MWEVLREVGGTKPVRVTMELLVTSVITAGVRTVVRHNAFSYPPGWARVRIVYFVLSVAL